MTRRTVAIGLIALVVLSIAAGWIAATRIKSPAEEAARTAAPDPSPILVPVESKVLSTDIVTRGTARFGSPQQLSLAPTAVKPGAAVVDTLPLAGQELVEGDVVLTASGRPVFLLEGAQPAFRDLGPGIEGNDVLQLEQALARLGFPPGPVDGLYDSDTELAVVAWYDSEGLAPVQATEEQLAEVRRLEGELVTARLDIISAKDSVALAERDVTVAEATLSATQVRATDEAAIVESAKAEAKAADDAAAQEVAARQVALDEARNGTPARQGSAAEIAAAEADLEAARAAATATATAGAQAVADAQAALDDAPAALAAAQAEADANDLAAEAALSDAVAALEALQGDPSATPEDIARAELAVDAADAAVLSTHLAGQQAVAAAQRALAAAPQMLADARAEADANNRSAAADVAAKQAAYDALRLGLPTGPGTPSEIATAEAELRAAQANAEAVRVTGERSVAQARAAAAAAQAEVTGDQATVNAARTSLGLAQEALITQYRPADLVQLDLNLSQRRAGVQVPANEIVFVPRAPIRVSELLVTRGADALGAVLTATDATVYVDGSLALDEAPLVRPGTSVQIDEPDLGIETLGIVNRVAEAPGTDGVDGYHIYMEVLVEEPPANLVGASTRLTIAASTSGEPVMAVPLNALTLGADGTSKVQVDRDGALEKVTVIPGISAGGYVEVSAVDEALRVGDLVVVGVTGLAGQSSAAPAGASTDTSTGDTSDTPSGETATTSAGSAGG